MEFLIRQSINEILSLFITNAGDVAGGNRYANKVQLDVPFYGSYLAFNGLHGQESQDARDMKNQGSLHL